MWKKNAWVHIWVTFRNPGSKIQKFTYSKIWTRLRSFNFRLCGRKRCWKKDEWDLVLWNKHFELFNFNSGSKIGHKSAPSGWYGHVALNSDLIFYKSSGFLLEKVKVCVGFNELALPLFFIIILRNFPDLLSKLKSVLPIFINWLIFHIKCISLWLSSLSLSLALYESEWCSGSTISIYTRETRRSKPGSFNLFSALVSIAWA